MLEFLYWVALGLGVFLLLSGCDAQGNGDPTRTEVALIAINVNNGDQCNTSGAQ